MSRIFVTKTTDIDGVRYLAGSYYAPRGDHATRAVEERWACHEGSAECAMAAVKSSDGDSALEASAERRDLERIRLIQEYAAKAKHAKESSEKRRDRRPDESERKKIEEAIARSRERRERVASIADQKQKRDRAEAEAAIERRKQARRRLADEMQATLEEKQRLALERSAARRLLASEASAKGKRRKY